MLINALKSHSFRCIAMLAILTQGIVACTEKEPPAPPPPSTDETPITDKVQKPANPHKKTSKPASYTTVVYEKDGLSVTLPEHWKVTEDGQGSPEDRSIVVSAEGNSSLAIKLFHTDAASQAVKMSMDEYLKHYLSLSGGGSSEMKQANMGRAGYRGIQVAIKSNPSGEFDRILEICELPLAGATAYVLVDSTKDNYSKVLNPLPKILKSIAYNK